MCIPLTEKIQFPHHQEQNYVKDITDRVGGEVHTNIFKKIQNSNTMHVNGYVRKYHRLWMYSMKILHVPYKVF